MPKRNVPFGRHAVRAHPVTIQLIKEHYKDLREYLFEYVFKLVKDEEMAKDLVGDALLDCLSKPLNIQTNDELRAYLYVICHNKTLDYINHGRGYKNKREVNMSDPDFLLQYPDIDEQLLRDEVLREFQKEVLKSAKHLPRQQETVIKMTLDENKTAEEIGLELGIPVKLVRSSKSKALVWLKKFFNGAFLPSICATWIYYA